jgi:hypothetical protein
MPEVTNAEMEITLLYLNLEGIVSVGLAEYK